MSDFFDTLWVPIRFVLLSRNCGIVAPTARSLVAQPKIGTEVHTLPYLVFIYHIGSVFGRANRQDAGGEEGCVFLWAWSSGINITCSARWPH